MKKLIMVVIFCLSVLATSKLVEAGVADRSEIRGVFIHDLNFGGSGPDWEVITETCKQYGINTIYAHMITAARSSRFPTSTEHSSFHYWIESRDHLRELLDAAHARGIEVHVVMIALEGARIDEYRAVFAGGDYGSGTISDKTTCPVKTHDVILDIVEELIVNYPDIDGFMYDYIRYDYQFMCYCPACKAQFQEWLGEGEITDWSQFYYGGSRWSEFAEWRTIPVSNIVRDVTALLRAHKPDIKISVAPWTYFSDSPIYWRKFIGQDTGLWVKEGWVDTVAPMHYQRGEAIGGTNPIGEIEHQIDANLKYMVAGPEGKVEYLAFLRTYYGTSSNPEPQSIADMKLQIDYVRSREVDGWVLWHYGGPGDSSSAPDIRDYLELIPMPDVFTMENIQVQTYETQATITWSTSLPATSKVEYNSSPLFTASFRYKSDFGYWDVDHVPGSIVEDTTNVTSHSIPLTGLIPGTIYYYRVQSQDDSGIATSKVFAFKAGEGPVTTTTTTTTPGTTTTTPGTTTSTTTTTTIPIGQVTISGQLRNDTGTIEADVSVYNERTSQINNSQTTMNGDYSLGVWPDVYDLQYEIFYIPNLFIKLTSLNALSGFQDVLNYVNTFENGVSFAVDITTDQEIQVYSEEEPRSVKVNGTEMTKVSSQPISVNEWYYNSTEKKLYMMASPTITTTTTVTTTLTTTTVSGTTSTTTTIPSGYKTFGNTNVGASSYGWAKDKVFGSKYTAPENGIITRISWRTSNEGVSGNAKAAIYSDNNGVPNLLLGYSTESAVSSSSWINFTLTNSVAITAGNTYWLVIWQQYPNWYRYDSGSTNQLVLKSVTYGSSWPDPFGSSEYASQNMSIFATYTPT